MCKGRTVGQLARYLRRHVPMLKGYDDSVWVAIGHFKASGEVGQRKLVGSKLTYQFALKRESK